MNLYDYDDALNLTSLTTTGSLMPLENKYSSISTGKNLKSKTSPDIVIGYGKTTDELIEAVRGPLSARVRALKTHAPVNLLPGRYA